MDKVKEATVDYPTDFDEKNDDNDDKWIFFSFLFDVSLKFPRRNLLHYTSRFFCSTKFSREKNVLIKNLFLSLLPLFKKNCRFGFQKYRPSH